VKNVLHDNRVGARRVGSPSRRRPRGGRREDAAGLAARDEQRFKYLRPTGTHAYAWIAKDLNPAGAVGNASNASAERGRIFADAEVSGMLELLREVEAFPLPQGDSSA